jgi:predicted transcriptional regulator
VTRTRPLSFDPIEEARHQWILHGWPKAADGMAAITSVMRAQQIYLARIDTVLRPFDLTFARFELLTLLSFAKAGSLPMNKSSVRLQVHPTSVTNSVDRLEAQGLVQRLAHHTDRRTTLSKIRSTRRSSRIQDFHRQMQTRFSHCCGSCGQASATSRFRTHSAPIKPDSSRVRVNN